MNRLMMALFLAMFTTIVVLVTIILSQRSVIAGMNKGISVPPDTIRDTIYIETRIDSFKVAQEVGIRKDTVFVPIIRKVYAGNDNQDIQADTVRHDSAMVEIPITQKCFVSDSSRIYVSGFNQNVDSAFFYVPHVTRYVPVEVVKKQKSHIALSVGASSIIGTDGKVRAGVGVTIGYVLWQR